MKLARLAVLGVAVCAGGVAAFLAGNSKSPPPTPESPVVQIETTDILIANGDIPIGRGLKAQDVAWQSWPTKFVNGAFIRKVGDANAGDRVSGTVARAPFVAGEPIREAKLIKATGSGYMAAVIPAGMRAVSTEITPESGAGGFILPNDRVDVILTSAEKAGGNALPYKSQTLLTDVRVLAIDQALEEKTDQKTAIGKVATLELSPGDAEKLALARRLGNISLVLRSLSEKPKEDQAEDDGQRQQSVTIVRFGQPSPQ